MNEYEVILKEYLKNDITEKVEKQNDDTGLGNVHDLLHRPVIKPNRKTTKVRILEPGPSLIPLIFDILLRFRTGKIMLIADMKQAFLQINISKEHRDLLRFIWFERDHFNEKLVTYRFKRVVFGLNCSLFLLNATIKLHLSKYILVENFTRVIEKLIKFIYG